jgi:ornithine carbamoyltransferase
MEHLLKLLDVSTADILSLLDLADQLKYELKNGIPHPRLAGKTVGMIFQKTSTRTRVSLETGLYQLGGHALFLSSKDLQIGRGELTEDTARTLSRYVNAVTIRTYNQQEVEDYARYSSVPVINAMTDFSHPCQVLADLMTVRERYATLDDLKVCYIGDGDNMANSLIVGALKCGMKISVATPAAYKPHAQVMAFAEGNPAFTWTTDVMQAAADADVIFTDTWVSQGKEAEQAARLLAFQGYQVNDKVLSVAHPGCMVQHCLPAYRGQEITADVFEAHADEIFEEAENRLHAEKAIMVALMEGR